MGLLEEELGDAVGGGGEGQGLEEGVDFPGRDEVVLVEGVEGIEGGEAFEFVGGGQGGGEGRDGVQVGFAVGE